MLVLGALVSLPWTVHEVLPDRTDAVLYVLTAQSLLEGNGYSYLGEPFEQRPPGFPVLLTPLLAWLPLPELSVKDETVSP